MHIRFVVLLAATFAALSMLAPPTAVAQDDLTVKLAEIEKSLWKGWAANDPTPFEEHMVENALQIGGWGVYAGKAGIVANIASGDCDVRSFEQDEFQAHMVGPNTAILTYEAEQDAVCDGTKLPKEVVAGAVYVMIDGEWKHASYQESLERDDDDDDGR